MGELPDERGEFPPPVFSREPVITPEAGTRRSCGPFDGVTGAAAAPAKDRRGTYDGGDSMSLQFRRNEDGTVTGRNENNGFTVTHADEEEVKRQLFEDAGWEYTPPPPPLPPGHHRFLLVHEEDEGDCGFGDERYTGLRARPPEGCVPVDRGCFALECRRPGSTLLDAVAGTVAEIRRAHGVVMNAVRADGRPGEWPDIDAGGEDAAEAVAHLVLTAAHRSRRLGYGRKELVRLLDATGIE